MVSFSLMVFEVTVRDWRWQLTPYKAINFPFIQSVYVKCEKPPECFARC